jgi:enoyl-CoA hydratase/carnithine racemase
MSNAATTPEVRMTIENHVAIISVDNAAKKNAFTPEMM